MDDKEKMKVMDATINTVKSLISDRLQSKVELLLTLTNHNLDGLPEPIQKMREEEASRVRAVIQEQKDIIGIINALFPSHAKEDKKHKD